jgi:hypothetical protein
MDEEDGFSEYSDYIESLSISSRDSSLTDSERSSIEEEDYEEEERKYKYTHIYDSSLVKYPIDLDIKNVISKKLHKIDLRDLNHSLLISSMVILAKSGNKIDSRFPALCDEVIETVIKTEAYNNSRSREKLFEILDSDINQLKRDLLRYCRFVLQCTE